jgi:hypothetical protein
MKRATAHVFYHAIDFFNFCWDQARQLMLIIAMKLTAAAQITTNQAVLKADTAECILTTWLHINDVDFESHPFDWSLCRTARGGCGK